MKKNKMFALSGFVALLLAAFVSASGCAKASDTAATPSNGPTVFFPNVSI